MAMPFSACIMIDGAVARGALHGPQDLAVGGVEHARVGHEQLEARDALADERVHLLERRVVDVGDDHVEAVVDGAVALGLCRARRRAPASSDSPLLWTAKSMMVVVPPQAAARVPVSKSSAANVPPKGISMWVWASIAARHDVQAGGVAAVRSTLPARPSLTARGEQRGDRLPVDQHVGRDRPGGGDDRATADERLHRRPFTARPAGRRSPAGGPGRTATGARTSSSRSMSRSRTSTSLALSGAALAHDLAARVGEVGLP